MSRPKLWASRMGRILRTFLKRDEGVVAVIFAVMAIPFIAMAGWAVDYLRLQHVKEYLQVQVDAAALNTTFDDRDPDDQWAVVHDSVMAEIARQYGGDWARNVVVEHEWIEEGVDVMVTARADVPLAFMDILPGIPHTQLVSASAVARVNNVVWDYDIEIADLDYEAGDYNRVWAYCYWPARVEGGELPKRTQMVPIADNGGPANKRNEFRKDPGAPQLGEAIEDAQLSQMYQQALSENVYGLDGRQDGVWRIVSGAGTGSRVYKYIAPLCRDGSFLSFRLENVRFARTQHQYWEKGDSLYHLGGPSNNGGDRHYGRYDYYTDSFKDSTATHEQYSGLDHPRNGSEADVLETVLCDTLDDCKPDDEGGDIPTGTGRAKGTANERDRANQNCSEGQYMYYGWEDRPPGQPGRADNWQYEAWTDADFDDIRVILKCPELKSYGERNARLIG